MQSQITILGGGAMATACAVVLAEKSEQRVVIWARNNDYARSMSETRENQRLLPGVKIPDSVSITSDINEAIDGANLLVLAIPSRALREALTGLKPALNRNLPVVSVIKGIENGTFMRPSEIVVDVLGPRDVVVLGGPSHAEEIARRRPASLVAGSSNLELAREVQAAFSTERFRVYTNPDIVGVEMAGALKNVIAIAAGISDGLQYGDNAKSALITRGLVEITRFGERLGAEPLTFAGLAGMGDLITTCTSQHSRNRRVGDLLGQGQTYEQIAGGMAAVAEGVTTTKSVFDIAAKEGIDMPITDEVYAVLYDNKDPREATDTLMLRPPRGE